MATITILQLPSDFDDKYKKYRQQLLQKHQERSFEYQDNVEQRNQVELEIIKRTNETLKNLAQSPAFTALKKQSEQMAMIQGLLSPATASLEKVLNSLNVKQSFESMQKIAEVSQNLKKQMDAVKEANSFSLDNEVSYEIETPAQESSYENLQETTNQILEKILKKVDELSPNKKKSCKYPYTIPSGTKWEDIIINFIDDRNVDIRIPSCDTLHTSYADMCFADGRNGKPTKQWGLLQLLARRNGSLPPDDSEVHPSYKKAKQKLEKQLKEYFGIEYDFFKKYNSKDGYVTKATIIYSENSKDTTNPKNSSDEVQEMFDLLSRGE